MHSNAQNTHPNASKLRLWLRAAIPVNTSIARSDGTTVQLYLRGVTHFKGATAWATFGRSAQGVAGERRRTRTNGPLEKQ